MPYSWFCHWPFNKMFCFGIVQWLKFSCSAIRLMSFLTIISVWLSSVLRIGHWTIVQNLNWHHYTATYWLLCSMLHYVAFCWYSSVQQAMVFTVKWVDCSVIECFHPFQYCKYSVISVSSSVQSSVSSSSPVIQVLFAVTHVCSH